MHNLYNICKTIQSFGEIEGLRWRDGRDWAVTKAKWVNFRRGGGFPQRK